MGFSYEGGDPRKSNQKKEFYNHHYIKNIVSGIPGISELSIRFLLVTWNMSIVRLRFLSKKIALLHFFYPASRRKLASVYKIVVDLLTG